MSSEEIAIRVTDVSKHYAMFERPEDRLKQMVQPRLARLVGRTPRRYFRDFAALSSISFEVKRGETVGIIGRNGCGKSTLLQIVCGTLQPTSGTVEVNGRIAALLELGAGFNPEFTGRENVFMNAAILGLSQAEIDARFDDIARFADIGIFIDQPVKTYSSGMYVRLAFAVAINVDPDILVVDEALAVGDEAFQRKCFARIENIKDKGGTILFVSHGAQTIVQLCDRAMLLDRGEKILEGRPKTVVSQYQRFTNLPGPEAEPVREAIKAMDGWIATNVATDDNHNTRSDSNCAFKPSIGEAKTFADADCGDQSWLDPNLVSHSRVEYENGGAKISDVKIVTTNGTPVNNLEPGKRYIYQFRVLFEHEVTNVGFGSLISTASGLGVGGFNAHEGEIIKRVASGTEVHVSMPFENYLVPGSYFFNAGVVGVDREGQGRFLNRIIDAIQFRVSPRSGLNATGVVDLKFEQAIAFHKRPESS